MIHEMKCEVQTIPKSPTLFQKQTATTPWRAKGPERCRAFIRYDDSCSNGHNSFAITGETEELRNGRWREASGGCIHDTVAKYFPELKDFIKWHLFDSTGPMHGVANAIYHAGNRDCHGLLKGEKRQLINGRTELPTWHLAAFDVAGNEIEIHNLPKQQDALQCPETWYHLKWVPWCRIGEGKERDLKAARSCAVWPDATDDDLILPGLKERLEARLPALLVEFKQAIADLGLQWEPVNGKDIPVIPSRQLSPKFNHKQYMAKECTHQEYFGQFVTDSVLELVVNKFARDKIVASTDDHFNDIPLAGWDDLAKYVPEHVKRAVAESNKSAYENPNPKGSYSLSDMVCVLKAAAHIIRDAHKDKA